MLRERYPGSKCRVVYPDICCTRPLKPSAAHARLSWSVEIVDLSPRQGDGACVSTVRAVDLATANLRLTVPQSSADWTGTSLQLLLDRPLPNLSSPAAGKFCFRTANWQPVSPFRSPARAGSAP